MSICTWTTADSSHYANRIEISIEFFVFFRAIFISFGNDHVSKAKRDNRRPEVLFRHQGDTPGKNSHNGTRRMKKKK
jgi:hypothetical protein